MSATALTDVLDYVSQADEAALTRVYDAYRKRRNSLETIAAGSVSVNSAVELKNLKPKYLNGLKGTVTEIDGSAGIGAVALDGHSTDLLRWSSKRDRKIPPDARTHTVRVPVTCMKLISS